jgi:hypothetical protein
MATTKRITKRKKETILDAINDLKPSDVVEEIGNLQNTLQSTLAGLSAQISSKVEQMRTVDEAIQIKETELTELYDIEREAMSLEDMKAKHTSEKEAWLKEAERRNDEWEQEEAEMERKFQRMQEEHNYTNARQIKQSQDDFNAETTRRRRDEEMRQDSLERQWKDRENELVIKEQKLAEIQTEINGFNDKLKSEISKAEAIVTNRLKKEYEHQMAILQKDIDAERNLHDTKISALDDTILNLNNQINDLQIQLSAARADVKEVTSAALQSASGHQAMQALQRVVDVGQNQTKNK